MSSPQSFNCPSCGASLPIPADGVANVQCPYCKNTVVVPREMRTPKPRPQSPQNGPQSLFGNSWSFMDPQMTRIAIIAIIVFGLVSVIAIWEPWGRSSSAGSPEVVQAEQTAAAATNLLSQAASGTRTGGGDKASFALLSFGGTGTAPGLFQEARYAAVDGGGNIYVADEKTKRVQKFDATGKYVSLWSLNDPTKNAPVSFISDLSADLTGNVYVTADSTIYKYDGSTGKLIRTITGHNYKSTIPLVENGILATASSQTPDDLVRLDADGKELWYKNGIISSQPDSQAPSTLRVAVDGLGNIFALQDKLGEIFKFTRDGKFVTRFGSKGGETGQFNADGIGYIAVDNVSNVYVSDFEELYVFDLNGRFLKSYEAFLKVGGGPRDMIISPQNELFIVQDDNVIYKLPLENK